MPRICGVGKEGKSIRDAPVEEIPTRIRFVSFREGSQLLTLLFPGQMNVEKRLYEVEDGGRLASTLGSALSSLSF